MPLGNPIDLRWIAKGQLALIGVTDFCIDVISQEDGAQVHKLRIRNDRERFIYELHGGDAIVWQSILKQHADAVVRWYFPMGMPTKKQYGF